MHQSGPRRALAHLDAGAWPPHRTVIRSTNRRSNPPVNTNYAALAAPPRPPRPIHVPDDVLTDAARQLGMARIEIIDVVDTSAGRVITTHDGVRMIVVPDDRPDVLGQTGPLLFDAPPNYTGRRAVFEGAVARTLAAELAAAQSEDRDGPWTLADLDLAASQIHHVPAPVAGHGRPTMLVWVGGDPVRARRVWLEHARDRHVTPAVVVAGMSQEAAACRAIVLASGWLAEAEAAAL